MSPPHPTPGRPRWTTTIGVLGLFTLGMLVGAVLFDDHDPVAIGTPASPAATGQPSADTSALAPPNPAATAPRNDPSSTETPADRPTETAPQTPAGTQAVAPDPAPPPPAPRSAAGAGIPPIEPPRVRGLQRVPPVRIHVPSLGIASDLVELGLEPGGALQVPRDYGKAGWYVGGPYPGEANSPPSIIVGHVDSTSGPAVFFPLRDVEIGAEILVTRADGTTAVFEVTEAVQYPKTELPTRQLYAHREASELVLITCTGEFDRGINSYLDNFVVTARLDRKASKASA